MKIFSVRHISAGYENKTVLHDISFELERGTILGIAGPNGSGKSTLLKSVCGLLPHEGCCGFDLPFEQMNEKQISCLCSYLPQKSGLTVNLSVFDVVLMAFNPVLGLFSSPTEEMASIALKTIEEVGLKGKVKAGFLSLSGGEKQLCLLARALVRNTPLLIMDEPENSLDPSVRVRIMDTVKNRVSSRQTAAVVSLHDMNLALHYCDRILLLKEGRCLSFLEPRKEAGPEMENRLSELYGRVYVRQINSSDGGRQLVMISEMH